MRTWLVDLRRKSGLSQMAVAKAAGMAQSYYAMIETGDRGHPLPAGTAKRLAAVLGFEWTRFFEDAESA